MNKTVPPSGTMPLRVAQIGFMLERMAKDCGELQFLRELTQNSIESILRLAPAKGEIVWDVDWTTYDIAGCFKLSITDNGDGMTGEDMIRYINHLSSSGGIQAHDQNYGVGAKIAAATRNPAGLIYLSWRDGIGSVIHFWRDPQSGEYGLQQLKRPDDTYGHWARVENSIKPEMIQRHGTRVILNGMSEESNTMLAPPGASSPSRWVTRYLNTRYFCFPKGITVKAREGWEADRSDSDRHILRTITGQKKYLDDHAMHSGTVALNAAKVHWWILKNESALSQNSGFIASNGHCAALWKDELYEMSNGRANTAVLQNFGIIFGYHQVVLYLEPISMPGVEILTTTSRTNLLLNGNALPWADWQDEFRLVMPKEITSFMESVAAATQASDHQDSIKDRLKQIADLFKLSRYRAVNNGPLLISGESQASGGGKRGGGRGTITSSPGENQGKTQAAYSLFLSADGVPGAEAKPDAYPQVVWVSVLEGTRMHGDMEDRAAKYLEKDNMLQVNADFRVFTDMITRWSDYFSAIPGAHVVVTEVVREWFEQSLVEAVLSSNALRNAQHWSIENVRQMLSEESLTAVVLPRWHIEQSIKRALGSKFGALKVKNV